NQEEVEIITDNKTKETNEIMADNTTKETIKLSWTPFSSDYLPSSCEKLPSHQYTSPRKFYLIGPKSRELTIFLWKYLTYASVNEISWKLVSKDLCPYPPELLPFFQKIFNRFARQKVPDLSEWPKGYAPCWFWAVQPDVWETCANGVKYRLTSNYTQWREADVIYMNYPFFFKIDDPPYYDIYEMPPRNSGQVWWLEFPTEGLGYYWFVGLKNFQSKFDITMGAPAKIFDIFQPTNGLSKDKISEFYKIRIPFDRKKSDVLVAWMAGNCDPKNNRNDYVQELMKYMAVDSFGICLHNKELPDDIREKYNMKTGETAYYKEHMYEVKVDVFTRYKFVLAFENSNCDSYVTEKVYDPLKSHTIPIYMGASDIDDFVPPNSIIKVTDFKNVKDLANYINVVANNQTLYESYFEWKNDNTYKNFCKACQQSEVSYVCRFLERAVWV
ncbi:50_t:CDS:1, partial [Scutellospora calospora]